MGWATLELDYDSSNIGRLMSADPFNPFELKPKQFRRWISNPQRWNKYAYALNNPVTLIDPDGLNSMLQNPTKGVAFLNFTNGKLGTDGSFPSPQKRGNKRAHRRTSKPLLSGGTAPILRFDSSL